MIPTLQPASTSMRRSLPGGTPMRVIAGLLLVLWIVLPVVPVLLWSVAVQWAAPAVLPPSYSLQSFSALAATDTVRAAGASSLLGVGVATVATPLGYLGALAIQRLPRVPARLVELTLLAPLAIPPFALVMGINVAFLRFYLLPSVGVVLVLAVTALPYTAFMFRSALATYDSRFEEVARSLRNLVANGPPCPGAPARWCNRPGILPRVPGGLGRLHRHAAYRRGAVADASHAAGVRCVGYRE
ncbi:hypothetical protein [Arthrobacter sp. Br18]|uniref:ABC transporter permease n=1 Tax=Arthrobacter sp. Br18 TaxID=1312954 RepID=UPI0004B9999B|nr:hypothetical protein [Arthrobacter sp. Br18]